MLDKTVIDKAYVNAFLDKYSYKYPLYEEVMAAVKGRCVGAEMPSVPGCATVKLVGCLISMMAYVSYIISIVQKFLRTRQTYYL